MATSKASSRAPQRACPKCGAMVHVEKALCQECGHQFPRKKDAVREGLDFQAAATAQFISEILAVVKEVGGVQKLKEMIATFEATQKVIDRLGGIKAPVSSSNSLSRSRANRQQARHHGGDDFSIEPFV